MSTAYTLIVCISFLKQKLIDIIIINIAPLANELIILIKHRLMVEKIDKTNYHYAPT